MGFLRDLYGVERELNFGFSSFVIWPRERLDPGPWDIPYQVPGPGMRYLSRYRRSKSSILGSLQICIMFEPVLIYNPRTFADTASVCTISPISFDTGQVWPPNFVDMLVGMYVDHDSDIEQEYSFTSSERERLDRMQTAKEMQERVTSWNCTTATAPLHICIVAARTNIFVRFQG